MPPRDPSLPEGTDHIIDTNIDVGSNGGNASGVGGGTSTGGGTPESPSATAGTASGGGSTSADDSTAGGSAFKFDTGQSDEGSKASGIMGQVKEQISTLKSQAGDRARSLADDGKGRATDFLSTIADIVSDAAGSVEDHLGERYAGVGNRASDSIQSFASNLDERSVEDLLADAKAFVQRSPILAIGIAAVIGFAVARVVRSSVSEFRGGQDDTDAGGAAGSTGGATDAGAV